MEIARLKNEDLRDILVERVKERNTSSSTIQKIASNLNGVYKHIEEETEDEGLKSELLGELQAMSDDVPDYDLFALKNEVDV